MRGGGEKQGRKGRKGKDQGILEFGNGQLQSYSGVLRVKSCFIRFSIAKNILCFQGTESAFPCK